MADEWDRAPDGLVGVIAILGDLIEEKHGENPCNNTGARYSCPVFTLNAYDWSWSRDCDDRPQPINFTYGDVNVRWYKWIGRDPICNDAGHDMTGRKLIDMLYDCALAIEEQDGME